jgi:hypothetical protein
MTFNDDFKEELSELSSKEKDKLILRLLKKDIPLANRLYFELVDNNSCDERRGHIQEQIERVMKHHSSHNTPGYLMMDMRFLSGGITEHVKTTKDKYGEVSLSLFLMIEGLENNQKIFEKATKARAWKCSTYIIAKAFKTLILYKKLHVDIQFEFQDDMMKLGKLITQNPRMLEAAIYHKFDMDWLLEADVPEDIVEIEKAVRKKGFLTSRS